MHGWQSMNLEAFHTWSCRQAKLPSQMYVYGPGDQLRANRQTYVYAHSFWSGYCSQEEQQRLLKLPHAFATQLAANIGFGPLVNTHVHTKIDTLVCLKQQL